MAAELSYTPNAQASLSFGWGCLWAALRLRVDAVWRRLPPELTMGMIAGLLFFAHSALPDTNAWPLIWPGLGGALAARLSAQRCEGCTSSTGTGAKAGAACAAVFFLGGAALLSSLEAPQLENRAAILVLGAALGLLLSTVAANVTGQFLRSRPL
jgi:hypothetical protein